MNAIAAATNPDPLPRLWDCARALLAETIKRFGTPSALAAHARLNRILRRALLPWVRSLEELVRKLLLAEAVASIPHAAPAQWRPPIALNPFKHARDAAENTAPKTPRASFNLNIPRDERLVPNNSAPRIRALWDTPTAPAPAPSAPAARASPRTSADRLALRFEALRCVIESPALYVRRLAARLVRFARNERVRAAMRFVCRGPDRVAPGFGDVLSRARALVFARAEKLGDTS